MAECVNLGEDMDLFVESMDEDVDFQREIAEITSNVGIFIIILYLQRQK